MKRLAGIAAVPCAIALAAALGVPVASWAAAVGMLCFVLAACALVVGAEDTGKALMKGFVLCLFVALLASAGGAAIREALRDPRVQAGLCVLLALVVLIGAAYVAAKGAALDIKRAPRPKLPLSERAAVVEPVAPRSASVTSTRREPVAPTASPFAAGPEASRRRERKTDDDLGLFSRGGRS